MELLLLRFFERITAVLIGGMSIYLGFRLFLEVPEHKDSSGKFALPWDISIVLTRVGPGVFFALFGITAASLTLIRPLTITSQRQASGSVERLDYLGGPEPVDQTARADARVSLRKEIAVLNTIPRQLRTDLPEQDRASVNRTLAQVKLELMRPVWGDPAEGYGEITKFEEWVREGEPTPPPAGMNGALALYRYGTSP
jgi:hypothetical protein